MAAGSVTFEATVVQVDTPVFNKTAKGGYTSLTIAYKRDGKVDGKKLVDFTNKEVFNIVKGLQQGQVITVTATKDANNYWQWESVDLGSQPASTDQGSAEAPAEATTTAKTPAKGRVTGSNYETPEERAENRRRIIRQACLNMSLAYAEVNKVKPNQDEVIAVAAKFEAWVLKAGQEIQDIKDDIPF